MSGLRWVRFESTALFGTGCEVKALDGEDELNRLFRCTARLALPGVAEPERLARALLGNPATLVFEEDDAEIARVHGLAAEVRSTVDPKRDLAWLSVTLVPRAWLLSQTRRSEVFLDRSAPEILAHKLAGAGLEEGKDFVLALRGAYPVREQLGQYGESDLDFFCRLCEDWGIAFFFRHQGGRDVLVLTDALDTFEPTASARLGAPREGRGALEVTEALRRVPARALVHDNNHRAPRLDLRATTPTRKRAAAGAWIEYGVHAKTPEEAAHFARVRAEELGAAHEIVMATSTDMALRAGATCVLVDGAGRERAALLTKVVHRARFAGGPETEPGQRAPEGLSEDGAGGERIWHNELTAIPKGVPFRPPRRTPRPKIPGLVHAVIHGAREGPYAELDEAGRYQVRLGYDLSLRGQASGAAAGAAQSERATSRPVRMLQPHGGPRYGLHFPLRPGTEVMLAFVEGDPDRPVIVGAVPNAEAPSPVERANQTQNVVRTASDNELVIEDLQGSERIRLHTPHATTTLQLGAPEEPERGALVSTDASITAAAAQSINDVTDRRVLLCRTSAALAGEAAVLLAGVEGLSPAAEAGMQRMGAVVQHADAMAAGLDRLAAPPGEAGEPEERDATGAVDARSKPGAVGVHWSDFAADLAARARRAAAEAIFAMGRAVDAHVERSLGRVAGAVLGAPADPSAIVGSRGTAALFGRDSVLVFGDRVATVGSEDTTSVVGGAVAQLKSPGSVELAGGQETKVTSAGAADVEARAVRIAGGYFPAQEAPRFRAGTTVGVVSRGELELVSAEDCVLVCADKNVVVTAHAGSLELTARQRAAISAGSVSVRGGAIRVASSADIRVRADGGIEIEAAGDVRVRAAGTVTIEGASVEIAGGAIALKGPVNIAGDLSVAGTVNGKCV